MAALVQLPTRVLFFTGKGGVGKTSLACATAIELADAGRRVLLVSTDPASNLDEVLGIALTGAPLAVPGAGGLYALNIDPERAAHDYRERVVGPFRDVLPRAAITAMEEQLSGACTVEIAAFAEFSRWLGDAEATARFDHVIFDTAPTGHTLRLLELPAAWSEFIATNVGGTSCLGPLSGLGAQRELYVASSDALRDPTGTTIVLVARPERSALDEAERTRAELAALGVLNLRLIVNGVFVARDTSDPVAVAMEARGREALACLPGGLGSIPRVDVPLRSFEMLGAAALRRLGAEAEGPLDDPPPAATEFTGGRLDDLIDTLATRRRGVVMTLGKGGVGKTTLAARIAVGLALRGLPVTLTTTDPAAHVEDAARGLGSRPSTLSITRIDPEREVRRYTEEVLSTVAADLDAPGRALLEEELRSPCIEEIAVFRAFAETVALGEDRFVIVDTAPTGHTLLLLDAAESYHREILRRPSGSPESVRRLLPRLRDRDFTHVILVTLPEATPLHEAAHLESDLARAGITPVAWVVHQSLTPLEVTDPLLRSRRAREAVHLRELATRATNVVIEPWTAGAGPRAPSPPPAPARTTSHGARAGRLAGGGTS